MKIELYPPLFIYEVGQRKNQEDEISQWDNRLFVLCDGMGGHECGEVASQTVCQSLSKWFQENIIDDTFTDIQLYNALNNAYNELDKRDEGEPRKMGTTLTIIYIHDKGVTAAHIGDSRIYHIRPNVGILYQSRDHSLVYDLFHAGEITYEEMSTHPQKNIITRAMSPGLENRVMPDIVHITDVQPGDYFFMCSDGMLERMSNDQLFTLLSSSDSDEEKHQRLKIDSANNQDNYSSWLLHVKDIIMQDGDEQYVNEEPNSSCNAIKLIRKSRWEQEDEDVVIVNSSLTPKTSKCYLRNIIKKIMNIRNDYKIPNLIKKSRWIMMTLLVLLLVTCLSYMYIIGTHHYSLRSLALITIGILILVLAYRIMKISQKYRIRTFSEIIDKTLSSGWNKQLLALLFLSTIAFLFSWALIDSIRELHWNGNGNDSAIESHHSFWLTICYFFDPGNLNITNHINPGIQGAVSLIVAVLGMTLLTGLFISTFTNIIEQRVESVKSGTITYKGIHSHYVIIGFCKLTEAIIRGVFEKYGKECKILLLSKENITSVRESLYDILNAKQYDGQLVIYSGDYSLQENLNRLNLPTSKEIYVLGEETSDNCDYNNFTCYQEIDKIISDQTKRRKDYPVPVYVRMDNVLSFSTFERLDVGTISSNTYFRPFNSSEFWAKVIWNGGELEVSDSFNEKKKIFYPSLVFNEDSVCLHLLVFGFNQMAQALVLHAIQSAHFFNYTEKNNLTTKITIVEPHITEKWLSFSAHFRNLDQVYDIEIDLKENKIEEFENNIIEWSRDTRQKLVIAICSENHYDALEHGLNLPMDVYYQHGRRSTELPIVYVEQKVFSSVWEEAKNPIQTELYDNINNPNAFRKTQYDKYHNVYPFGMKIKSIYPNEIEDLKACIIHADYEGKWCETETSNEEKITILKLYELVEQNHEDKIRLLINKAFVKWYPLPENIKSANRHQTDIHNQIKLILEKNDISSVNDMSKINDELLYICSDIEHRRWIGERIIAGWQQSPYKCNGQIMRQDALRMHYDIRKTSEIQDEISKDENVIKNVLMLEKICDYIIDNGILKI